MDDQSCKRCPVQTSAFAEDAGGKVKQAASDTAATLTGEVKEILNRQVGGGADMLGNVARSVRRAAEDIERDPPQIADLARTLATRVDGYAHDLRDQSVEQIWQTTEDFTRRQPAVVFGLAALAGFFALRIVKEQPVSASTADSALSLLSPGRRWYLLWLMSG